jgi:hypothetical protein
MSFSGRRFIGSPFSISRAAITLPGSTAGGGAPMPISKPLFFCPNCKALYQVVKAEAGPETADREITYQECKGPLPAREENSFSNILCCERRRACTSRGRYSCARAIRVTERTATADSERGILSGIALAAPALNPR